MSNILEFLLFFEASNSSLLDLWVSKIEVQTLGVQDGAAVSKKFFVEQETSDSQRRYSIPSQAPIPGAEF